jgi:hypothetical protein
MHSTPAYEVRPRKDHRGDVIKAHKHAGDFKEP